MGQSPNPEAGARVAALAEYQIMDTPAEAHFDDLVRLASYICKAPIALMSLLDADRQWFKARVGLDTTETPIAYSFCSRTVAEKNMLIVIRHSNPQRSFFMSSRMTCWRREHRALCGLGARNFLSDEIESR